MTDDKYQIGVARAFAPSHEIRDGEKVHHQQMSAVIEHDDGRVTAVSVAPGRTIHTTGDEPQPGYGIQFSRRGDDGQWETLLISLSSRAAHALGSLLSIATCDETIVVHRTRPPREEATTMTDYPEEDDET